MSVTKAVTAFVVTIITALVFASFAESWIAADRLSRYAGSGAPARPVPSFALPGLTIAEVCTSAATLSLRGVSQALRGVPPVVKFINADEVPALIAEIGDAVPPAMFVISLSERDYTDGERAVIVWSLLRGWHYGAGIQDGDMLPEPRQLHQRWARECVQLAQQQQREQEAAKPTVQQQHDAEATR